jgi:hypothetical protein
MSRIASAGGSYFKTAPYRSPALLRLAKDVPGCMGCGLRNDGTVVAAHSNQARDGKGRSLKAADYRIAFLCGPCHHELDQGHRWSREHRITFWEAAHRDTIAWLFESGHLSVT